MNGKIVELRNVTKSYGGKEAVKDITLTIGKGEIYGLIGENGAGKSTLLKMLAGHALPTHGEVSLLGETSEKGLAEVRRGMGFMVEEPKFYPYLTGRENIEVFRRQLGIPKDDLVEKLWKELKLAKGEKKKVKNYSTGMKQRLGILTALMNRPTFLVLDEPINGLDPEGIVELRNLLLRVNKEWGTTMLISSHILKELALIGTKFGFLQDGVLLEELSATELQEKTQGYLELQLEESDVVKGMNRLEEQEYIRLVRVLAEGVLRVYGEEGKEQEILKLLSVEEIYPKSVKQARESLEEYYLDLMGGKHNG